MKYIYLLNNVVAEIILEIDDNFPGFTVTQRYSPDFLKKCIKVDNATEVSIGMIYENGIFKQYIPPETDYKPPTPPETVDMEQMLLDQDFRLSMLEINM